MGDAIPTTVIPPADLDQLSDLSLFLDRLTEPAALLGPDGQTIELPLEAYDVLVGVVRAMRQGKAITVAPQSQRLTTQQAADFLGVSRPTLVKLLETGKIPFERSSGSRHRRVQLRDVLDYQGRRRTERVEALDELTRTAVEEGLAGRDRDSYTDALREARKRR